MKKVLQVLTVLAVFGCPGAANALIISYNLEWTGFGNFTGASATGMITVDWNQLSNPDSNGGSFPSFALTDLMITVTGTPSDGTWTTADFHDWRFVIPGTNALDPTKELVGQLLSAGFDPWGTPSDGDGGDFNLFAYDPNLTPTGCYYFILCPAGFNEEFDGNGLLLTSFRPKSVPVPGTLALFGFGLAGLGWSQRKKV